MRKLVVAVLLLSCEAYRHLGAVSSCHPSRAISARASCYACSDRKDTAEDSTSLYAALQQRRSQFSARRTASIQERELIKALADTPNSELAQKRLWEHWYSEEGNLARAAITTADETSAEALQDVIDRFPEWAEPINRLATLKFFQGEYEESIELCERVIRMKPWHFGALSGIAMCHAKSGNMEDANRWAAEGMPRAGLPRSEWVARQLKIIDERLQELSDVV